MSAFRAGHTFVQAMKRSKAPIYVVVKEYAGSMAAIITTLAHKSFAYPTAFILHHQPQINYHGGHIQINVRKAEELAHQMREIWKLVGTEVAKKLG